MLRVMFCVRFHTVRAWLYLQMTSPAHLPGSQNVYWDLAPFLHNSQRGRRYLKLNPRALSKHGTLEFRQPQSSTCTDEVGW
jgi:hypothetical protein